MAPKVEYTKATAADYDELMDFGNMVFSMAHNPHDFPTSLPKLYRRENNMTHYNYIVREDGKIKAAVGAYPLTFHICDEEIKACGIGMVSVHPYSRSKGYMKRLMSMALEDMKKEGVEFSCLGGQRQRYEYFGYTPCGTSISFRCTKTNFRHTLGKDYQSLLQISPVEPEDQAMLEFIYQLHRQNIAYIERQRERLYDILTSWEFQVLAILEQGNPIGYLLVSKDGGFISEIGLQDNSRLIEALFAYLHQFGKDGVTISLSPHATEKNTILKTCAENLQISTAYHYNILDYPKVLRALLKLKCTNTTIEDGEIVIHILEHNNLKIQVQNHIPSVTETDELPELELSHLEAMQLFFSPISAFSYGLISHNPFARNLFPLPLFFDKSDGI